MEIKDKCQVKMISSKHNNKSSWSSIRIGNREIEKVLLLKKYDYKGQLGYARSEKRISLLKQVDIVTTMF